MQIIPVQILRAIAALVVAVGHAQAFIGFPLRKLGGTYEWSYLLPWGAGVDLFFAISGFIMVYASERLFAQPDGARAFMWRRLTRIVPLYWAAMAVLIIRNALQHKPQADLTSIVASFLFIPWDTAHTGTPRPIYELGWTLNYEMFFYATFALFIALPRERAVAATTLALAAMVALGELFDFSNPMLRVWTQPIVFEFVFGMGLALLARRAVTLPDYARYGLIALAVAALSTDFLGSRHQPNDWVTPNDFARVFAWGLPAAMLLAAAVLKPRAETAPGPIARAGAALGDASYAFYLCHPMVMSAFAALWYALGVQHMLPARAGVAIAVALSALAALIVYRWFERPVTQYLHRGAAPGVGRQNEPLRRQTPTAAPR